VREKAASGGIGNRLAPMRFLLFLAMFLAGLVIYFAAGGVEWWDGAALSFDVAALVFLLMLFPLARAAGPETVRAHAEENDANRGLVLIVTTVLALAVTAAIGGEVPAARSGDALAIAKLVATLLLIWFFANSVFALHYAHEFYSRDASGGDAGGFDFPGTKEPSYGDFGYFAFTLGMTFQTSDVAITRPALRRIALLHSFGAFVFNIGVIAFAINVMGGAV
jgi:uncharacterized membrane protein